MEPLKQQAYRHLIYVSMLDMRASPPKPLWHWWSLRRWTEIYQDSCRAKKLADCFHNLAYYSVRDFEGFEEQRFWDDLARFESQFGPKSCYDYRGVFSNYLQGKIYTC
jgi:hypothetical protein